jgi:hypothetical protein
MRIIVVVLCWLALLPPAAAQDDQQAVRQLLHATFAVAGWSQGGMGGRALLRRGAKGRERASLRNSFMPRSRCSIRHGVPCSTASRGP